MCPDDWLIHMLFVQRIAIRVRALDLPTTAARQQGGDGNDEQEETETAQRGKVLHGRISSTFPFLRVHGKRKQRRAKRYFGPLNSDFNRLRRSSSRGPRFSSVSLRRASSIFLRSSV